MNFFTTVSSHWFWRRWRVRWSTVSLWERHNWCSCCPAQKEIEWKIHFAQGKITFISNLSSLFLVLMWRHSGHIGAQNNSEKKSLGTLILLLRKTWATFCHCFVHQFLVFTPVIRRPCWCTKQWQNVAHVLHNNRIKVPKDFSHYCSVHWHGGRDITWKPRIGHFQIEEHMNKFEVERTNLHFFCLY